MTLKDIRERTNQSQVTVAKELGWHGPNTINGKITTLDHLL